MRVNFIILIIIELFLFEKIDLKPIYLKFKTHKTEDYSSLETKEITEKLSVQRMYTTIKVGTPYQTLNMNIEMHHPYISIISKKFSDDKTNIPFELEKSSSYKFSNETDQIHLDIFYNNRSEEGRYDIDIYSENFMLDEREIKALRFFLVTKTYSNNLFNINSGVIGLDLNRAENKNGQYYKFMRRLKEVDGLDNYYFYFKYENLKLDEGILTLGGLPNETNKELNKYQTAQIYADYNTDVNGLRWGMSFRYVNISTKNHFIHYDNYNALNCIFSTFNNSITLHHIIYDNIFSDMINSFVQKGLCKMELIFNDEIITYNCINDKSKINSDTFPKLKFYHKEMNVTFELSFEDVSEVVGNRIYWLIHFYKVNKHNVRNVLGKPFLKKYGNRFYFNWDQNLIGYFTEKLTSEEQKKEDEKKNNKGKSITVAIIIIIILCLVLGVLGFYIYKKWDILNLRRKRATEIEDDYLYIKN